MINKIFKNEWFWFLLILSAGVFFRFWNITSWQHFTYDQSRDYLILKRIMVDHKFTLVGPTVSIAPGFFLPPFYYYSLVPFLLLSNFHIVGPDIYTAFLGALSIVAFYFLAKDFFGKVPALVSTFAFTLNPYLVQTSRHAWNPNTLFLFTILFFLSFEKYLFKKPASPSQGGQRKWLLLAGFSLGWAIGLHLTAVVFLPFFIYLIYLEIKKKYFDKITVMGTILFLVIFSPLLAFDLKHNFPITKAGISYLSAIGKNNTESDSFGLRFVEAIKDVYKMPGVLLSGAFQKQNMTVRPSNITAFSRVNIFMNEKINEKILMGLSLLLWGASLITLFFKKNKYSGVLLIFLLTGFLIRFCFPGNLFYFYYYLGVFPLIFMCLGNLLKTTEKMVVNKLIIFAIILLTIFQWFEFGFYQDSKPEKYFTKVSEIIAKDSRGGKVAIANNVGDRSRWEHNGLEYRYFAEALYGLKALNWEADDYKRANVLYFIDEGEVPDPLKFGGMEVEAFKPSLIEEVWEVEMGQKIYKLTN